MTWRPLDELGDDTVFPGDAVVAADVGASWDVLQECDVVVGDSEAVDGVGPDGEDPVGGAAAALIGADAGEAEFRDAAANDAPVNAGAAMAGDDGVSGEAAVPDEVPAVLDEPAGEGCAAVGADVTPDLPSAADAVLMTGMALGPAVKFVADGDAIAA